METEPHVAKLLKQLAGPKKDHFYWIRLWTTKGKGIRNTRCDHCHRTWFTPPAANCTLPVNKFRHETLSSLLKGDIEKSLSEGTPLKNWMFDAWIHEGGSSWRGRGQSKLELPRGTWLRQVHRNVVTDEKSIRLIDEAWRLKWQHNLGNHKYKRSAKGVITTRKGNEKYRKAAQKLQNEYVDEMDELTPGTASEIFSTRGKPLINTCLSLIKR